MPNKEELVKLYHIQRKTMSDIAELYGVSIGAVCKWFVKYDIKAIKYRQDINKPDKKTLASKYETLKYTMKTIGEEYGVGEKTIKRWFKEYGIRPIKSKERKYYHLRRIPFSPRQREFIVGSLLGDGHIDNGKTKRLVINHSEKQLSYLEYKKSVMSNYVNKLRKNAEQKHRNSVTYNMTSICHQEFNFFHKLFYDNTKKVIRPEIIKYLTPFVMAIWYMDDGSARKYNVKISTEGFSKRENEILRDAIYMRFDISCKVCEYNTRGKKYYYLSFSKKHSEKLCELIRPYIISSMEYKLLCSSTTETPSTCKRDDDTV